MKRGVILYPLCILKRERHLENGSKLWEIKYARNTFGSITTFFFWHNPPYDVEVNIWQPVQYFLNLGSCFSDSSVFVCVGVCARVFTPPFISLAAAAADIPPDCSFISQKRSLYIIGVFASEEERKKKSIWRLTRGQSVTARLDRHSRFNDDVRPWEFNIIFFCKWSQWAAENGLFGFIYTSWLVKARLPPLMPGHLFGLPALTCFWLRI